MVEQSEQGKRRLRLFLILVVVVILGVTLFVVTLSGNAYEYDDETIQGGKKVVVMDKNDMNFVESNETTMEAIVVNSLDDIAVIIYDKFFPVLLLVVVAGFVMGLINAVFRIEKK